jgi:hypothetical protein
MNVAEISTSPSDTPGYVELTVGDKTYLMRVELVRDMGQRLFEATDHGTAPIDIQWHIKDGEVVGYDFGPTQ